MTGVNNGDLQKEALQQSVAVSKLTMDVLKQTKKQLRGWQMGFLPWRLLIASPCCCTTFIMRG